MVLQSYYIFSLFPYYPIYNYNCLTLNASSTVIFTELIGAFVEWIWRITFFILLLHDERLNKIIKELR